VSCERRPGGVIAAAQQAKSQRSESAVLLLRGIRNDT
jgi:hypothetical protein